VIDCQVCVRANGKTSAHLKSVFKISTVCSKSNTCTSSKTWTPLPDSYYRWPPGGNVPTLRSGATSAGRRHEPRCGTHAPAASTKSGSRLG